MPYVSTGEAAKLLGVNVRTLQQWTQDGLIRPTLRTPGGQARWDVDRLREQLRNLGHHARPGTVAARILAAGLPWDRMTEHLAAGRVLVDGTVVTDPHLSVTATARIQLEVP